MLKDGVPTDANVAAIFDAINPLSYDLTRTKGRIEFHVRMEMKERLTTLSEAPPDQLTFADLQALPASEFKGTIPDNPL